MVPLVMAPELVGAEFTASATRGTVSATPASVCASHAAEPAPDAAADSSATPSDPASGSAASPGSTVAPTDSTRGGSRFGNLGGRWIGAQGRYYEPVAEKLTRTPGGPGEPNEIQ